MRPYQTLLSLNHALLEAYELLGGSVLERYLGLSLEALNARKQLGEECKTVKGCVDTLRKIDGIIRERKKLVEHIVGE